MNDACAIALIAALIRRLSATFYLLSSPPDTESARREIVIYGLPACSAQGKKTLIHIRHAEVRNGDIYTKANSSYTERSK